MGILGKIFSKGANATLGTVFDGIDKLTTTKEEKASLRAQAIQMHMQSQSNARELYKVDSKLQKVFAVVFLIGYLFITGIVLFGAYQMAVNKMTFNNETVAIITMLFTAMSNKINTIVDFLFGGSHSVSDITKK